MLCEKTYILNPLLCFVFLFFISAPLRSQFYNLPGDYSFSLLTEKKLAGKDSSLHAGVKPYIHFFSDNYVHEGDTHRLFRFISDDPAIDLLFNKHFLRVEPKKENFKLRLDPLLNMELGRDVLNPSEGRLYTNTRGLIGSGYVGNNVYFESLFAENQSFFPAYISNQANRTLVIPGQGRWKEFKVNGYDYAFSSGFVSVQVLRNLNIQVGHGKHKIGNGYRSLLLSDNSFNYPYARITQQWFKGKVQYTNIYSVFMNLVAASAVVNPNTERLFQKKAASFQYLSINPSNNFNLGLFQGMIWQAGDNRNRQHLSWQYFNPLIYTNLMNYGLNNKNNIVTGADAKLKLSSKLALYGQVMLDHVKKDSLAAGWGWQSGLVYFDALGLKNLFMQLEYNDVKRSSYSNNPANPSDQSYSHYNQTLAFTPGYGTEFVFVTDYKWKRFFVHMRYNYQTLPLTTGSTEYMTYVSIYNIRAGYLINPSYNLNICVGMLHRTQNFSTFNTLNNTTNYIYIGFKTSLYNLYYDF